VRLVKCVIVVWVAWHLFTWINASCGPWLYLSDIVPFAKSQSHSFVYDYFGCVMLGLTLFRMSREYGRRH